MLQILLAITVLGSIFIYNLESMRTTYAFSQVQNQRSACEDLAQSSMNNFRAQGFASEVVPLRAGAVSVQPADKTVLDGLAPQIRWPTGGEVIVSQPSSATPPTVRNFLLIEGGVATLNAILNSNGVAYCDNALGSRYVSPTQPPLLYETPIPGEVEAPQTFLRIQIVDVATGVASCPASYPFFVKPANVDPIDTAIYSLPANVSDRHALRATVTVQYSDPKNPGVRQSCQATADFRYPPLKDSKLNDSTVLVRVNRGGACSATTSGTVTLTAADTIARGQVLLCRDFSETGTGSRSCSSGPSAGIVVTSSIPVPCERARLCGRLPTSANWDSTGRVLTLAYSGLPLGCTGEIEVVALDPAGNRNINRIFNRTSATSLPACRTTTCRCNGSTTTLTGCPARSCPVCPPPPPPPPSTPTPPPPPSTPTPTPSPRPTATMTTSGRQTPAPAPSPTPRATPRPSSTPTPRPSATPTPSPSPTPSMCKSSDPVCALYREILKREPDQDGYDFWTGVIQKDPSYDLRTAFIISQESSCVNNINTSACQDVAAWLRQKGVVEYAKTLGVDGFADVQHAKWFLNVFNFNCPLGQEVQCADSIVNSNK